MVYHTKRDAPIMHTNHFINTDHTFTQEDSAPGMTEDPKTHSWSLPPSVTPRSDEPW